MASTGAEQCPNCGTLNEFGLPSENATVSKVITHSSNYDKNIRCKDCNNWLAILFD